MRDASSKKIWLASRQIGKSFSVALEAVVECLRAKSDNLILSSSERQSQEVMRKVRLHMRVLAGIRDAEVADKTLKDEVIFENGSRVISLPASPETVRGFSGNIFLDEFAFHRDGREIWRAMYPAVSRGFKVRVTSTPCGKSGMFYDLWTHAGGFSRHRTDIHEAASAGMKVDVAALREGICDADSWAQEFECAFLDEATAFVSYDMIASCESKDSSCESKDSAGEEAGPPPSDKPTPVAGAGGYYLGVDVGRRHDLTVFWLSRESAGALETVMVKEMKNAPFREQREFLYSLISGAALGVPVNRCCMDASGIGAQMAEEAREKFGPAVEAVQFTPAVKESLAFGLRRRLEEKTISIPADRKVREDFHSIRKAVGPAGRLRLDAERTSEGHGDRFWAAALAVRAAGFAERHGPEVYYESVARRDFILGGGA